MKIFIIQIIVFFFFSVFPTFAQLTVKDQEPSPNTLLKINDEGTGGSITLPKLPAIGSPVSKLYNLGGNLFWGSSQLGFAGSAGGWTDDGSVIRLSSSTDKVGIGTLSPSSALHVTGNDGVIFGGTFSNGTALNLGGGTKMMWYPKKAAFRAGYIASDGWNDVNIGDYSVALGYNSIANGSYSYALGMLAQANDNYSIAIGASSVANYWYSVAIGRSTTANGNSAMALGYETEANGNFSIAVGNYLRTNSYRSTAIGCYNIGNSLSPSSWVDTDPIFEIGIGSSSSDKKNAVTVWKNGKVGIGTAYPRGELEVAGDDGVIFDGTYGIGTSINFLTTGVNMMWYPKKAAFRAGYHTSSNWDHANIGNYSVALGGYTTSSGLASTSSGYYSSASGNYSLAIGYSPDASGDYSTAMGYNTNAIGNYSTSIGTLTDANGAYSLALGFQTTANGLSSTAMGSYVSASGDGSFIIGDRSTTTTTTKSEPNRFYARFARGYFLYTNSTNSVGAYLAPGGNSWTSISDSTKKENFNFINGEEVLQKISKFKLGSWNYIGQDPAEFRHYGPMAQDFYAAFGNDGIGTIGCDTLLSSSDFDGINLIAIQALEKRTADQEERITQLENLNSELRAYNSKLEKRLSNLESKLNSTRFTNVDDNRVIKR